MSIINPPFYIHPEQVADMTSQDLAVVKNLFSRIRASLGKRNGGFISITQYCAYEVVPRQEVEDYLVRWLANKAADRKEQNRLRRAA